VAALLREGRSCITALRVRVYDCRGRGVVGERSLGLQSTDFQTLAEELRATVSIHNGDKDDNASDHGTKANHTVGG
jgi:hypothetical protein